MVLSGSIVALTLAVVVSGGSIEIGLEGVKAELPPLAQGIAQLRNALEDRVPQAPTDFGVEEEGSPDEDDAPDEGVHQ